MDTKIWKKKNRKTTTKMEGRHYKKSWSYMDSVSARPKCMENLGGHPPAVA
jgi:hypothetical protein